MSTYNQYYVPYEPNVYPPKEMEERIFVPIKHLLNQRFQEDNLEPIPIDSPRWSTRVILSYQYERTHVYYALDKEKG